MSKDYKTTNSNNEWKVVQDTKRKDSNIFKSIGIIFSILFILGGIALGGVKFYNLAKSPIFNKSQNDNNKTIENNEKNSEEDVDTVVAVSEQEMIQINEYIHHMANTVIVAVDGKINGRREITMDSIDKALTMLKDVDLYLYNEVSKWKYGDLSNAVKVHNYVWNKLDGEIGKAKSLNEEAIEIVKTNLGL